MTLDKGFVVVLPLPFPPERGMQPLMAKGPIDYEKRIGGEPEPDKDFKFQVHTNMHSFDTWDQVVEFLKEIGKSERTDIPVYGRSPGVMAHGQYPFEG